MYCTVLYCTVMCGLAPVCLKCRGVACKEFLLTAFGPSVFGAPAVRCQYQHFFTLTKTSHLISCHSLLCFFSRKSVQG